MNKRMVIKVIESIISTLLGMIVGFQSGAMFLYMKSNDVQTSAGAISLLFSFVFVFNGMVLMYFKDRDTNAFWSWVVNLSYFGMTFFTMRHTECFDYFPGLRFYVIVSGVFAIVTIIPYFRNISNKKAGNLNG